MAGNKNTETEPNYIDDVSRAFYVYLHKDKKTNTPFYVGKGTGRRAYETTQRGFYWDEKVKELSDKYEVEIYKDNLSESEAYELEAELIKKYGRQWNNEGLLVNQTLGGDIFSGDGNLCTFEDKNMRDIHRKYLECNLEGFSELSQELQEYCIDKWIEKQKEPTNYKDLTKEEQKDFINLIQPKIDKFITTYKEIIKKIDRDEGETMLEGSIDNLLTTINKSIKLYNKRRLSFREFATFSQDILLDIECDSENPEDNDKKEMVVLAEDILSFFNPLFESIIDDNEEAEPKPKE